jgi:hypothetical protein
MNNPWLTIWTSPRETIKKIVAKDANQSIWILAVIVGFPSVLSLFMLFMPDASRGVSLITSAVLSPFVGMLLLNIYSWILLQTGKWLKGRADREDIRAALAWSYVPTIISLLLFIWIEPQYIQMLHEGRTILNWDNLPATAYLISGVFGIWALVLEIGTISQVQKFSLWRSFGNIILGGLGILIFWLIIEFIFGFFFGFNQFMGG